ncbi:MAG: hypothetical protein ACFFC7_26455 [Candidatus Hermodarchaeota archaeon]
MLHGLFDSHFFNILLQSGQILLSQDLSASNAKTCHNSQRIRNLYRLKLLIAGQDPEKKVLWKILVQGLDRFLGKHAASSITEVGLPQLTGETKRRTAGKA